MLSLEMRGVGRIAEQGFLNSWWQRNPRKNRLARESPVWGRECVEKNKGWKSRKVWLQFYSEYGCFLALSFFSFHRAPDQSIRFPPEEWVQHSCVASPPLLHPFCCLFTSSSHSPLFAKAPTQLVFSLKIWKRVWFMINSLMLCLRETSGVLCCKCQLE